MTTQLAPFSWTDIYTYGPIILGSNASVVWDIESAFGRGTSFSVDDDFASGRIEFLELDRGLRIVIFDAVWFEDQTFVVQDDDWIRFNFSLSIDMEMIFSSAQSVMVNEPSWRIINNPREAVTREIIPSNKRAVWVTVCCKSDFIEQICGKSLDDMPDFLQEALTTKYQESFYEYYEFSSRLNSITADVLRTPLSGAPRIAFIEARCIELLCYALDYILHKDVTMSNLRLSESDKSAFEKAKDILNAEFANPPTVSNLSKRIGMNRNKLYYGFKSIFGKPISEYVQEQRLEEARRLLRQTDLSITEIAHRVGYKHQSNFSASMKRHFGVTPKQFRS